MVSSFCLVCVAEARHTYCFSGVAVIVGGGGAVNFGQVFAFRSFSQKL